MAIALLNPYCTLEELCHELKLTVPANPSDLRDELHEAINNASRWVDAFKGRDYYQHDYTLTPLDIDEFGGYFIGGYVFLPYRPIIGSLTLVKIGTDTLVSNEDYYVSDGGTRLVRMGGGTWGDVSRPDYLLSITGKFGYAQTTSADVPVGMPGNIKLATRLIAASLSGHNRKEVFGMDGSKQEFIDRKIPESAIQALGSRAIHV